jgi:hypothetical protein
LAQRIVPSAATWCRPRGFFSLAPAQHFVVQRQHLLLEHRDLGRRHDGRAADGNHPGMRLAHMAEYRGVRRAREYGERIAAKKLELAPGGKSVPVALQQERIFMLAVRAKKSDQLAVDAELSAALQGIEQAPDQLVEQAFVGLAVQHELSERFRGVHENDVVVGANPGQAHAEIAAMRLGGKNQGATAFSQGFGQKVGCRRDQDLFVVVELHLVGARGAGVAGREKMGAHAAHFQACSTHRHTSQDTVRHALYTTGRSGPTECRTRVRPALSKSADQQLPFLACPGGHCFP